MGGIGAEGFLGGGARARAVALLPENGGPRVRIVGDSGRGTFGGFQGLQGLGTAAGLRDADVDLYAGGRYTALSLELAPARLPAISRDRDWTDPIIGAKVRMPLESPFRLALNGDVGGFGAASDFTWSATALVVLDFMLRDAPASFSFGYRAIGWNFTEGQAGSRFTWDVIQHGVIIGFGLRF